MDNLQKYIDLIIADDGKTVDEKIEEVMALRDPGNPEEDEKLSYDEREEVRAARWAKDRAVYSSLFYMLYSLYDRDREEEQMQLLTLLAETMVRQRDYKSLKFVADMTLEIMRDEEIEWSILEMTIPRIADAIEHSYYNHDLFEILLRYMRAAIAADADMEDIRDEAEKVVRLKILITDFYETYLYDEKIRKVLAQLFTSTQLVKIISRPDTGHLRRDPVEYTETWEDIIYEVEDELDERFANHPKGMGFCYLYWSAKRNLLREKYGIEWRSPSQMNPRVMFD